MMRRVLRFVNGKRQIIEKPMHCTPAQIRLALHRAGRLAEVQAIADADAEASIVWEYAITIERESPFIEALKVGAFTDDEIDAIFLSATEIVL